MESTIYTRLSTDTAITAVVSDRIYPVFPSVDTKLPLIVYSRSATEQFPTLSGPSSLKKYEFTVDVWSINQDTCLSLCDLVKVRLDNYRSGSIQGIFFVSQTQQQEELGFHAEQTYSIWSTAS